jgi:hypothetical protein
MDSSRSLASPDTDGRRYLLGVLLILLGLGGHLLAAREIGGSAHAFSEHTKGFLILTAGSAVIVWALSLKWWRGRTDLTVLGVGVVQLLFGVLVYVLAVTRIAM